MTKSIYPEQRRAPVGPVCVHPKLLGRWLTPPYTKRKVYNKGFIRRKGRPGTAPSIDIPITIPSHMKVWKSNKPSSKRTQYGYILPKVSDIISTTVGRRNRSGRTNRKRRKQKTKLIRICPHCVDRAQWSMEDLRRTHLVFDGSDLNYPPIKQEHHLPDDRPLRALRIISGGLYIADTKDPSKGLCYETPSDQPSPFIRLPRIDALNILGFGHGRGQNKIIDAMDDISQVQKRSLVRSKRKLIYSEGKYCAIGSQVCRASPGIRDHTYHKDKVSDKVWDALWDHMIKIEAAFSAFSDSSTIREINEVRRHLNVKTMASADLSKRSRIYGGIAFGVNVHLDCHTDEDYAMSIVTVHVRKQAYNILSDKVVSYFCFPRLGVAVALRPGDVLIFNPSEPHAVSSRCRPSEKVYCVSFYLKTAVVGGNDNCVHLTDTQDAVTSFQ